jgi:hypothetical protein
MAWTKEQTYINTWFYNTRLRRRHTFDEHAFTAHKAFIPTRVTKHRSPSLHNVPFPFESLDTTDIRPALTALLDWSWGTASSIRDRDLEERLNPIGPRGELVPECFDAKGIEGERLGPKTKKWRQHEQLLCAFCDVQPLRKLGIGAPISKFREWNATFEKFEEAFADAEEERTPYVRPDFREEWWGAASGRTMATNGLSRADSDKAQEGRDSNSDLTVKPVERLRVIERFERFIRKHHVPPQASKKFPATPGPNVVLDRIEGEAMANTASENSPLCSSSGIENEILKISKISDNSPKDSRVLKKFKIYWRQWT